MIVVEIILIVLAAVTLNQVAVVAIECVAAALARRRTLARADVRSSVALLVPAHNEAESIVATVAHLREHLRKGDRLLVVADNCDDDTAARARGAGAEVLERRDDANRGKGFALAAGVAVLRDDPPGVVMVVDADCRIDAGGVEALIAAVDRTGRPAQAAYTMGLPAHPTPRDAVSAFAFLFKNVVRPSGLAALGLPCLLTGTGMAFPWAVLERARLATGDIVEDMRLGVEMALAGSAPQLCPGAHVRSALPGQRSAALTQRTRWEHGHLSSILRFAPVLVWAGVWRGRPKLLALAAELAVPPLSLFVTWMALLAAVSCVAWALGASWAPALLMGVAWVLLVFAVLLGWWRFGRHTISLRLLLTAPFYLLWKLPMYARFVVQPEKRWVRTEREVKTQANGGAEG